MNIKDVIGEAVDDWNTELEKRSGDVLLSRELADLKSAIFDALADKIGATQEKLMFDLMKAREARDLAEKEAVRLRHMLATVIESNE